ncbi:hypothetical protein ACFPRB_17280 [Metabacillus niabensis]|uniref:Uncharacterized protein n=1 Tax=Metabacillus niabensis TaxID=324854 RepID=A0ABT9YWP2_9BACI|nr:hypothetical protein [Metabacillus niabensis]MDQ0224416.1 hypothetical protein [Metabacillus niabensis]
MGIKNETDRTTRLLITITFFGGTWYLLRGIINLWGKTFSEIVYTKSILNYEHIVSIWLLVVMVILTGTVIIYIYSEFKTYQYLPNKYDKEKSINKADRAFNDIFNMIKKLKFLSILILIPVFLIMLFTQIKMGIFLLIFVVELILVFIYMFFIKEKLKNQIKRLNLQQMNVFPKLRDKFKHLELITYLLVFVFIVSISLIVISIEGNQEVEMKINDTKKIPMEILLNNYEKPTIEINIIREKRPTSNVKIDLEESELQKSFIEVYESRISKGNFLLKESEDENKKVPISKNKYFYKYNLELEEYLLEGENFLEIYIQNNGNASKKTVHIVTPIYKEGEKINIPRENFKITP